MKFNRAEDFHNKTISWSELSTHSSCERQWFLGYKQRLQVKRSLDTPVKAHHLGSLVHELLASYYSGVDWMNTLLEADVEAQAILSEEEAQKAAKTFAQAQTMMEDYQAFVEENGKDDHLEVVAVEQRIHAENARRLFKPPWPIGWGAIGFVDLVARDKVTGALVLLDHKTTRLTYTAWMDSLFKLRWQMMYYGLLYQYDKPNIEDVIVEFNVMRSVKVTPRTAPPMFWRYSMRIPKETLIRARRMFAVRARRLYESYRRNTSTPAPGQVCSWCPFNMVCPSFEDGTDVVPMLSELYERKVTLR